MKSTGFFTSSPKNVAAWALKSKERPLTVSSAPYTKPPKGHVVIKVYDVAVNPIDWILQEDDIFKSKYPTVFGSDAAGEISEVADDVKDFQIGTRVIAHCSRAPDSDLPSGATGAFQKYVVVQASAVAELPYKIPSSTGVVLPLGISTASAGLYQKDFLNLPYPVTDDKPKPLNRTLLVWGGSSSVGSCALQLAVASGVEVVTTCSENNFDYVKGLGAAAAFDYRGKDVEDQVVKWLDGKTVVGAYHAVGEGGAQAAARIVDRSKGKAIVVTVRGVPEKGVPSSVRMKAIGATAIFSNEVGPKIWREFLPKALKNGTIVPKPDPKIVGENLRSVQLGLDTQKKGVSAEKVVVSYIN
ncbi:Zinc-binding alcohol dehydrogenase domain-containing protein cipB [Fulvia fulva]|uniref:Zinc-binding alcohol dehydrogenase domain-containing protein cipB n=1 Tax=Passalora fulva TaxID=5499 RepID=A0A9Q8PJ53_PASFU|nr:Zinc-binding alcohol dehydrogenase domain-containing protein cipB [Fulvia fulva]KAK4612098.1 Zinc-binding alcohol dehydrogenase domain-containing protein cipB [Fulvia fulva]KAK4612502.1 Zinc-binding alcohol dehydrogenase domain-containing protein cipB [Fulvia fulva]UJO23372.1 Zinc-binding alcohol dehydrogenase domain-containing protein cipB [Fulvia fulva]WPV21313.1 Zinc-binding alcohol dehydrogenase domain-containing protein cipB [Fulvia fulva]WPV36442.1 Zinc-binding alcohol dehydrogenase d